MWVKTTLLTPRPVHKEGKEVLQVSEIHLQPMVRTMSRQLWPCSHWGPWRSRDPPAPHGGPHARAGGCPKVAVTPLDTLVGAGSWQEPVDPWRTVHPGTGLLAGLWPRGGSLLEQPVPEGLCLMKRTHAGTVSEELQTLGRTHTGKAHEGLCPMGGISHWKRGWSPPPWGGKSGRHVMNWPQPRFPVPLLQGEGRELKIKLNLGKQREESGGDV